MSWWDIWMCSLKFSYFRGRSWQMPRFWHQTALLFLCDCRVSIGIRHVHPPVTIFGLILVFLWLLHHHPIIRSIGSHCSWTSEIRNSTYCATALCMRNACGTGWSRNCFVLAARQRLEFKIAQLFLHSQIHTSAAGIGSALIAIKRSACNKQPFICSSQSPAAHFCAIEAYNMRGASMHFENKGIQHSDYAYWEIAIS